jgi:hypothetical protein
VPWLLTFTQYVVIVVATKEDLKYDSMSADEQKGVDAVRTGRDECVKKLKPASQAR